MGLEINERDREGIAILDMEGRLVSGAAADSFRDRTQALVDGGQANLILNLLEVESIDSGGLEELVSLSEIVGRGSGRVKLIQLNKENLELLVLTKLTTVFDIYDDEQDAVNSFFPDRQVRTFDLLTFVKDIQEKT